MTYYAHPTAVIDDGCEIGNDSRIWHFCHIMTGAKIGERCTLGQNVMVASGVILGDNVKVQNNVSLYTGVTCEDDVFIGPSVVFTNVVNPRSAISRRHDFRQTSVRRGATIGANATIICGNEIGAYAFVGAGAVVTGSVKPYELVIGNPAQHKGWVSESGHTLEIIDAKGTCPETQQEYILEEGNLRRSR